MATKLYLKNTTDSTSGLPTAEQSTKTSGDNFVAQSTNNVMNTAIGASQTTRSHLVPNNTLMCYLGRWVSPALSGISSISANTWTLNFAATAEDNNVDSSFPVDGTNQPLWVNCYVWRPGTSSKLGTILDGNTASVYDRPSATVTEKVMHGTFTGASVASVQDDDKIIIELWADLTNIQNQNWTHSIHFGGSTENTTENATVSNHASFLETPQTLTFFTPPPGATITTEKGTFTKPTSTGAQSQTVNLVNSSLIPKFLILWSNGLTTEGTYTENIVWSYGFSDGTNDACQASAAIDNATTQNEAYSWNNNCIVSLITPHATTPVENARADVTSFNAGNFVLNWTSNTNTAATVIHYIVGGGTGDINASVVQSTITDLSTGNHSFNGSGTTFTPDFALIMTGTENGGAISINTIAIAGDNMQLNLGAAGTGIGQFAMAGRTETVGTSDTNMVLFDNACITNLSRSTGAVAFTGDFTSLDNAAGGGITINITEAVNVTPTHLAFLFIKGGSWQVGTFQQRSGTGTQDVTFANNTTITPSIVFLGGVNTATANASVINNYLCLGASDGTREGCTWCGDQAAQALMVNTSVNLTTKVYRQAAPAVTASSSTTNAECDMQGMATPGQFTLNWTTADTTLRRMAFWALGSVVTAGNNIQKSITESAISISDSRTVTRNRSRARVETVIIDG